MELEPYGGFVRDVLIREDWHPSVDLDVCAANCRDAATRFVQWLGGLGVACTLAAKGEHVQDVQVTCQDSEFHVQFVNTHHFENKSAQKIDLDVNNLKLTRSGIAKRIHDEGPDIDVIILNVRRKQFSLVKPPAAITERLQRVESRGWHRIANAKPVTGTQHTIIARRHASCSS